MRIIGRKVEGKADRREPFVQFSIILYDKQKQKPTHSHALTRNKKRRSKNFTEIMFDGKNK